MSIVSCYYSDLLDPCRICNTSNPRMWRYRYPLFPTKPPAWDRIFPTIKWQMPENKKEWVDIYCWGVFCEKCRSHKVTEINKHEEIEDAIESWNINHGNVKQKTKEEA